MLTSADLLVPKGIVDTVFFPKMETREVQAYVDQFLSNGYNDPRVAAQTDVTLKDNLARSWALYQTFDFVAARMTAQPLVVAQGTDGGTSTYSAEQIKMMQDRANKYLADFLGMLNTTVPPQGLPGTVSVQNVRQWL